MKKNAIFGISSLLLAAFIWGTAFVAQDVGMNYVAPFTFQSVRSFIGGIVLLPVVMINNSIRKRNSAFKEIKPYDKNVTLIGGICCGIVLSVAACFQQFGIKYSSVGKAGFITALYVIFVPICSIFLKRKIRPVVIVSSLLAAFGLYLLCMSESFSLSYGDTLLLICSLSYTAHIIIIDKFSQSADCIKMSCIQFFTAGLLSAVPMFLFEQPNFESICLAWLPILYAGALSSGVAYTLQIVGQKHTEPTVASLIMSLESVFAVLAGAVLLNEIPTVAEAAGCFVLFGAIILAQLPSKKTSSNI